MRQRCHILDCLDHQASGLKGRNSGFSPRTGAFDPDLDLFQAKLRRFVGSCFRCSLRGKRRTLAAPLEANRPGRGEAKRVAVRVGDRDDRVIERRFDMSNAPADVSSCLAFLTLGHGYRSPLTALAAQFFDALLPSHGFARTFPRTSIGFRPLTTNGQASTMTKAAVTTDVAKPGNILLHLAT